MWIRGLRRWIWRANASLAALVLATAHGATTPSDLDIDAPRRLPALTLPDHFRFEPAVNATELAEHVQNVRSFHGRDRPPLPDAPLSAATEPPLSAYRVVLYIRDPDGRHALTLRCKDPAHDRVYRVRVGENDGGVALLAARFGDRRAFFDVTRGREAFTFQVPIRLVGGGRGITAIGSDRRPSDRSHVRTERTPQQPIAVRALKFVPFTGVRGDAVGVRVTGVKPGSWLAELGIKPGDVITAWDGESVRRTRDLHDCAEDESLPRTVRVLRGVARGSPEELELRRS